jgi:hypothetical protein
MANTIEITIDVPNDIVWQLDNITVQTNQSRTDLMIEVFEDFLKRHKASHQKGENRRQYPRKPVSLSAKLKLGSEEMPLSSSFIGQIEDISLDGICFIYKTQDQDFELDKNNIPELTVEIKIPKSDRKLNFIFDTKRIIKTKKGFLIGASFRRDVDYKDYTDFLWMIENV